MSEKGIAKTSVSGRRHFLKKGGMMAGAAAMSAALLGRDLAFAEEKSGSLPGGDAAILRFLAAAEIIETDLWIQYAELGGVQSNEIPGLSTKPNSLYTAALQILDGDIAAIHFSTIPTMKSAT